MMEGVAVKEGEKAPDFDLPADGGGRVRLGDFKGRPLVLYFYPRDDTPGCTKEAMGFSEAYDQFQAAGVEIVGISKDGVADHERFKAKYELPFALASDEECKVIQAYGSWVEKSRYGRRYMGTERSTFLIDGTGTIRKAWRDVKVPGHVAEVLEAARSAG